MKAISLVEEVGEVGEDRLGVQGYELVPADLGVSEIISTLLT